MNAYMAVALCWITGLGCGTYLIATGMPWWGIAIAVFALMAGTSKGE